MNIEVVGEKYYTVSSTDEEMDKDKSLIKDHEDDLPSFNMKENICQAVTDLYQNDKIDLYSKDKAAESDFITDRINWSEFEERTAEEILNAVLESEKNMEFEKGDRVFHKSLQLEGTFVEYDWTGKEEAWVDFDNEDGYEDCRHISTNQLELIEKEYSNDDKSDELDR